MQDQITEKNRSTEDQNNAAAFVQQQQLTLWGGIKVALIVLLAQMLVTIPAVIISMALGLGDINNMDVAMGIALALSFPAAAWIILRFHNLEKSAWDWIGSYIVLLPISIIMLYGMSYAVGGILSYLPGYDSMLESYGAMFENINPTLLLIAGGFIGPVCEEVIFRGVILKGFLKTFHPAKAIIFSSLIFGVIHFMPLQVISAFFAGLVLGYIYYKTRSLWLPIIIHVINNVIAFTLGLDAEQDASQSLLGSEALYIASFAGALLISWLAYMAFEYLHGLARQVDTENHSIV